MTPYQNQRKLTACFAVAVLCTFCSFIHAQTMNTSDSYLLAESAVSDAPKMIALPTPYPAQENWSTHAQITYITQQKNDFTSPYSGANSLLNSTEGGGANSYTFSATAFLGRSVWNGGAFYYNPEVFQGVPFNDELVGLGGFQNGELQKGSFTHPVYYTARAFFRQTFNLGGEREQVQSSANQLAESIDQNRIVLSVGKFATLDFFDQNAYSHDPRTQFQNFALFSMGAYNYAADTKGYTFGAVVEWYHNDWIIKTARFALPTVPNTENLDFTLRSDYIDQIEFTHQHDIGGEPGAIRAIYYRQYAYMGNYSIANSQVRLANTPPDITATRQNGQRSWGYGFNVEQALTRDIGLFARWSWNPGNTETQTLDISRSLSGGLSIKGAEWSRANDTLGIGFAVNGLANAQINYLQQGGLSPFIGDGALNYKNEEIFETYYNANIYKDLVLTFDYQCISNPAYNAARGPINFFGMRLHLDI